MASADRRRAPRLAFRFPIRFWNHDLTGSGYTINVSTSGLYVESPRRVENGTHLHFEVTAGTTTFVFEGIVARTVHVPIAIASAKMDGFGVRALGWSDFVQAAQQQTHRATLSAAAPETPGPALILRLDLRDRAHFKTTFEQEIAYGGLFVPGPSAAHFKDAVDVELLLPNDEALRLPATVVQVLADPPGTCLELTDAKTVRERLQQHLAP